MLKLPQIEPITCEGCGACCMHMRTPPHLVYTNFVTEKSRPIDPEYEPSVNDANWLAAAPQEARDIRFEQLSSDAPDLSPCCWFDMQTRQCKHYEFRPTVCREFEIGSEGCEQHRENLQKAEFAANRHRMLKAKQRK